MFDEIQPSKNKKVIIAEQILDRIKSGEIQPGDKLPSENELASRMNVSRPSIREALSGLQALDIIFTKIGSGTYISESLSSNNLLSPDLSFMEHEISYIDIIEARKNLENSLLDVVIKKIETEDLEEVKNLLGKMEEHSTEMEYEDYMDADHDFHQLLVQLTKNPLFEKACQPLLATINDPLYRELTHKYYLVDDSRIKHCFNIHKGLYQKLAEKDLEGSRNLMEKHWQLMENALEMKGE